MFLVSRTKHSSLRNMEYWELAGVAAWFEAEGSASIQEVQPGIFQAKINLSSIDEEVIDWLIATTGVGKKYYKQHAAWQPLWVWSVHRQNDFFELAAAILPLLLTARKTKQVKRVRQRMRKYLAVLSAKSINTSKAI